MKKTQGLFVALLILLLSCQTGFARDDAFTARDWHQRGVAYANQGVYGEAINMFTAAIAVDPTYAEAYMQRGKAYRIYDITATHEALEDFSRVIALTPRNAEAYYQRGLLYEYIIKNTQAKSDMITAAGLGHEGAQRWLLALNNKQFAQAAPAPAPQPAAPTVECEPAMERGFDLADYLPGGMQPIVYFDFDRSRIRSDAFPVLDAIAAVLKEELPQAWVLVVGHTDSLGTEKYNAGLSLRRAEAVKAYLTQKHGVAPGRIAVEGYGKMAPADTNETEEGRARNRRAAVTGIQK